MNIVIIVVIIVVFFDVIIVAWGALIYNKLVRKRNEVENAFGGMDVQLKKRYDLIPNLVETVKQYATHEKELLTKVTEMRAKTTDTHLSNNEKVALDNAITSSMRGIMVAVENYPELKSNENFINLQRALNEAEAQVSAARRTYNAAVTEFNNSIETFPNNIVASFMKLKHKEVFKIEETERQNVNVKNLF